MTVPSRIDFQKSLEVEVDAGIKRYLGSYPEVQKQVVEAVGEGKVEAVIDIVRREVLKHMDSSIKRNGDSYLKIVNLGSKDEGKSVVADLIRESIRREIDVAFDDVLKTIEIEKLREMEKDITFDPLTGAYNIKAFRIDLEKALARHTTDCYENGFSFCFIFFDVDNFKEGINDKYGHYVGDQVLREIGRRVRNTLRRETDVFGRRGGDEFVISLPRTPLGGACLVAHNILDAITSKPFEVEYEEFDEIGRLIDRRKIQLNVSASFGVSVFDGIEKEERIEERDGEKKLVLKVKNTDPKGERLESEADNQVYIPKGKQPDKYGVQMVRKSSVFCQGQLVDRNLAEQWLTQENGEEKEEDPKKRRRK